MTVEVSSPHRFRTLVIWCPDWPAVAGARQLGTPSSGPVAVFKANRVVTCTAAARAEGIVVGQRRRDAQSRCPDLLVVAADQDRDARLFEPVVAAVESVAPGVEILRPGMIACSARGPAKYFGGEAEAAERIVDIVEALDVECRIGIADSLAVAVLAARHTRIVPSGDSADFCAALPVVELARDPAIAPPERAQLVDLLIRLGITTAGQFAALPQNKVATRFGADAVIAHLLAAGAADRGMSRRVIPEDLAVQQFCDPPLDRVDTAAFAARALAELFHARLADAGLACTRLAIAATTDRGQSLSRIWRCAKPLTPAATADRLRWQLDGWLTAGRTVRRTDVAGVEWDSDEGSQGPGAITMLRLEPIEAIGAGLVQYGLWGSDGEGDQRAGWAFARVQGLLGPESVLGPVLDGGRGPIDRISLVPWGEERTPVRDPAAPWPGALPAPSPTRVSAAADLASAGWGDLAATSADLAVTLADEDGLPVTVTSRGLLSGTPVRVSGAGVEASLIQGWAGPWLLDEQWWRPNGAIRAAAHPSSTAVAASRSPASRSPASRSPASGSAASGSAASGSAASGSAASGSAPSGQEPGAYSMGPYDSAYAKPERGVPVKAAAAPQARAFPSPGIGSTLTAPAKHQARLQILPERGPALLLLFGVDGWQIEGRYD